MIQEIISIYADKCYDTKDVRNYLGCNEIRYCIPYKSKSKFTVSKNLQNKSQTLQQEKIVVE